MPTIDMGVFLLYGITNKTITTKGHKSMKYTPKTGVTAGKRNFEMVREYLKKHPDATGVEIAKKLSLSLPAVYRHLKNFK